MLQKVLHYNVTINEISSSDNHSYYDLLVYLFPYYLEEAMRKGFYKEYVYHSYNDSNVRGQLDINRTHLDRMYLLLEMLHTILGSIHSTIN